MVKIQLSDYENFCLLNFPSAFGPFTLYVGLNLLRGFLQREGLVRSKRRTRKVKKVSYDGKVFLLLGSPRSGKTLTARFALPYLLKSELSSSFSQSEVLYVDMKNLLGISALNQKILLFNEILLKSAGEELRDSFKGTTGDKELLMSLFQKLNDRFSFIILDNFEFFFVGLSEEETNDGIQLIEELFQRSSCTVILTGGVTLGWFFHERTCSFLSSCPLELSDDNSCKVLKDTERLHRLYFKVDKYSLRELSDQLGSPRLLLRGSALVSQDPTISNISCQLLRDDMEEVYNDLQSLLEANHIQLLLVLWRYLFGGPKAKNPIRRFVAERKGKLFFLRNSLLQTTLLLHFQPSSSSLVTFRSNLSHWENVLPLSSLLYFYLCPRSPSFHFDIGVAQLPFEDFGDLVSDLLDKVKWKRSKDDIISKWQRLFRFLGEVVFHSLERNLFDEISECLMTHFSSSSLREVLHLWQTCLQED